MTVYVDDMCDHAIGQFGRMKMSHLFADTDEELHEMAARIGVARRWHQRPAAAGGPGMNASWSHYDISKGKRALALAAGAQPVKYGRELVDITRKIEERRSMVAAQFEPAWPIDAVYDVETFPNVFLCTIAPLAVGDDRIWTYEVSRRRGDAGALVTSLRGGYWKRLFGFNNIPFDWPVCHEAMSAFDRGQDVIAATFHKAQAVLAAQNTDAQWSHRVSRRDMLVPQVDIRLVHHMDNPARMTSLKALQFAMRSESIEDMPFKVGTELTDAEIDILIDYNVHDVRKTKDFVHKSWSMIEFREKLIADGVFNDEALSFNDTKIGKQFFIKALEERQPGICFDGNRKPRQTWRHELRLGDVLLPNIGYDAPHINDVLQRLKDTSLVTGKNGQLQTKGVFDDLAVRNAGMTYWLGTGGIHGSVDGRVIIADEARPVIDIDVTSFYPSIAIVNKIAPAHLGSLFYEVYAELMARRVNAKKNKQMVEADALKLALNGVYGDSNNIYGPFYDPAYTMAITVNGQLLLLMLAEKLQQVPGLELLQINTDGMTFQCSSAMLDAVEAVTDWWQWNTGMLLERADYRRMWIRDVNNYVAEPLDEAKPLKLKGAYDYTLKVGDQYAWHKDPSALVIPKAAVAAMVDDQDPLDFIEQHVRADPWDFLLRAKATHGARLVLGDGTELSKTVRYYLSTDGQPLKKIMQPLKGKTENRIIGVHAEGQGEAIGDRKGGYYCSICGEDGPRFRTKTIDFADHNCGHVWKVTTCNRFTGELRNIDLNYYLKESSKLVL
jgi:hypothetical protein